MKRFYSNGKLILTGEYVVLDGAKALAIPTKYGQDLIVKEIEEKQLVWTSFTNLGEIWFEATFDLPDLKLKSSTFISDSEKSSEFVAETLQNILLEAQQLNPDFLKTTKGFAIETNLTFDRKWGLGSSSTLINNIANWAEIDAYTLLWNAFSGSGFDIACAKSNSTILYEIVNEKPVVQKVVFNPDYKESLFFVYLNKKKNSREGIANYRDNSDKLKLELHEISHISRQLLEAETILDFEKLIRDHERIIGNLLGQKPVKEELFPDYLGEIKSLGAWGGDFVLVTGNEKTPKYFIDKGYNTVIPFNKMAL